MRGKGNGSRSRSKLLPNSLRIISSCLKTVSSNAGTVASTVRSAGASVAASIAASAVDIEKDQVLWAGFDKLELSSSSFKHVLLLGYTNGFQVLDVEDATNFHVLVSKRNGPVTFLQMQPIPSKSEGPEGFRSYHPMLLFVAGDETNESGVVQGCHLNALTNDGCNESQQGICIPTPTILHFFSLRTNDVVHVLRFRSAIYVVRCSLRVVAVALASQIFCFDAVTLENKFSVLTYPVQRSVGINVGYGPMALNSRWLAYSSNNPLLSNTGRLSAQNLNPSPGVSPSTSPGNGTLVARYAMESSKQLAAGIINLGDKGYKTLSKYCQDIRNDDSNSSISSKSGRKTCILPSASNHSEADNAGMVVIKDFVSKDVISQFRAHTSPISALCFDPTGTILVTASIHGNNINVFRVMPKRISDGLNSEHYDWASSHVHLYKLHRGLTKAVIQDISFSNYSEWISIVSSRGTCHIYLLSPFGGNAGLETQNSPGGRPILVPSLSLPWWSTSSSLTEQQATSPPPPVTLSVVSRIKNGYCGWLNTVSSVAASATGKALVPCGAVTSVFHNSTHNDLQKLNLKACPLEKLLVHSPSGHVIQYVLVPSANSSNSGSRMGSSPFSQVQDDELHVIAEPIQCWDVCRRSNWPEQDDCISDAALHAHKSVQLIVDASHTEENHIKFSSPSISNEHGKKLVKAQYLSNAEVRGGYGSIHISQKSKVCFFTMNPLRDCWRSLDSSSGGEIEIEKVPVHEVEIRQKDLFPVFQQSHGVLPAWHDRSHTGGRYPIAVSLELDHNGIKLAEDPTQDSNPFNHSSGTLSSRSMPESEKINTRALDIIHSVEKPGLCALTQDSSVHAQAMGEADDESRKIPIPASSQLKPETKTTESSGKDIVSSTSKGVDDSNSVADECTGDSYSSGSRFSSDSRLQNHSYNDVSSDTSTISDLNTHVSQSLESLHYLEGNCKLSELDNCRDLIEAVTDADSNSSSSQSEREKLEEDGDNDMLGGVFAFEEEDAG